MVNIGFLLTRDENNYTLLLRMKSMMKSSKVAQGKISEIKKMEKAMKQAYTSAEKFLKSEKKRESNSFQVKFV